jgi:DNA-binding GntR family transcriptional regulator
MAVGEAGPITILQRERNQPIHQWVYEVLRTAIIEIHIRPTQAISETAIANLLGVSRTPVREAFIRLAEDGLLKITPQKRSVVTPIDLEQAEEARFIRRALEKAVMEEVCGRLTAEDRSALAANLEEQRACRKGREFDRMLLVDNDFHRIIFRAYRKEHSWRYIKKLDYNYDRLRTIVMPKVIDRVISEHQRILEVLSRGAVDQVEEMVDGHLDTVTINRTVGEYPSHFFAQPAHRPEKGSLGDLRRGKVRKLHRPTPAGKEAAGPRGQASLNGSTIVQRRKP